MIESRSRDAQPRARKVPRAEATPDERDRSGKEERFAVVKLRFEIPPGGLYFRVSKNFPEGVVEVMADHVLPGRRMLVEMQLAGPKTSEMIRGLEREPGVVSVSPVPTPGPIKRVRMITRTPPFILVSRDLEVLIRFPRFIQDGVFTIEVASRVSQLRKLIQGLRRVYVAVDVVRFGRDRMRTYPPTLTPYQDALLHMALGAGYFDVPRRITLTGLATRMGKSKSSLSRRLAIVEKKLAESAVAAR